VRRRLFFKRQLLLTIGLLSLFATLVISTVNGAAKRGDAPRCQEECLADHQRQLEKLIKDLEEKRNKFEFQDYLEDAVKSYGHCVENCREPQPVK
jgi:hypothetical protein